MLTKSKAKGIQGVFDQDHPVSDGFATLYEGYTICYPESLPA